MLDKNEPYKSFDGHGVDIAVKRADDLDKKMLEHLQSKVNPEVLDLGCGAGGQSFRMVETGALVTAIDSYDFSKEFDTYKVENKVDDNTLQFIQGDISDLATLISGKTYSDVCVQRTLHYLPYTQAFKLLSSLSIIIDDRLYISVTGIDSDVGKNYTGKEESLEARFEELDFETKSTFNIHKPVCLYTKDEFVKLLESAGWEIDLCWTSAFGNIKAVCVNSQ